MSKKLTAEEIAEKIRKKVRDKASFQYFKDGLEGKDSDAEMIEQYAQSRLKAIAEEVEGLRYDSSKMADLETLETVLQIIQQHLQDE